MSTLSESINSYLIQEEEFNEEALSNASLAFLDAYGCILDASSDDRALKFALPFEFNHDKEIHPFQLVEDFSSEVEVARYLGTLVRWHDYNDTFLAKEWAHPSDNIGGVWSSVSQYLTEPKMKDVFVGLIKSYEIQGSLALGTSLNQKGYDHVFYVKLATAAFVSSIIPSSTDSKIIRTINNVLNDGLNLRAYRHEPNVGRRKSWAAGDATARGLWLAQISSHDDNEYYSVQNESSWGFEKVYLNNENLVLGKPLNDWVIKNILYKVSYPAEFHGQSAIEAAVLLHPLFKEKSDEIKEIIVETQEPALRIISKTGLLENESARDHCLEYMVSVALLDGKVTSDSYRDDYERIKEVEELRKKFKTIENKNYTKDYYDIEKRYIANKVSFKYTDDSFSEEKEVLYPIGHPARREEAIPLLKQKFINNCSKFHSKNFSIDLWNKTLSNEFTEKSLQDFLQYILNNE